MHSDWFNGIEILQGSWQHGEKVGYCYPRVLEKTLCKWDIYVLLVTKGLSREFPLCTAEYWRVAAIICHYAAADVICSIVHSSKLTQKLQH